MPAYKDEKTGTWFVKFYVKDWTGANKQVKKRGFATKREALEFERSYKVRQESNLDMTFEVFFKIYSEDMELRLNGILINEEVRVKDAAITRFIFITINNGSLNAERYLGIRNNRRKKECVRMPACCTENTGNTKKDDMISHPDFTQISAIPDERTGETTGTENLVQIQRINDFIVKILRNRVVKIHFNSYHNRVHGVRHAFGVGGRVQTLVGESSAFRLIVTIHYDNTKSLRIKQSDG